MCVCLGLGGADDGFDFDFDVLVGGDEAGDLDHDEGRFGCAKLFVEGGSDGFPTVDVCAVDAGGNDIIDGAPASVRALAMMLRATRTSSMRSVGTVPSGRVPVVPETQMRSPTLTARE